MIEHIPGLEHRALHWHVQWCAQQCGIIMCDARAAFPSPHANCYEGPGIDFLSWFSWRHRLL
eukprot:5546920-Pyramimonas_sp.AAC.1